MSIQKIDAMRQCQPLKQSISAVPLRDSITFKNSSDRFDRNKNETPEKLEAKYDFACRLAAFYKNKYESLVNEKTCCV